MSKQRLIDVIKVTAWSCFLRGLLGALASNTLPFVVRIINSNSGGYGQVGKSLGGHCSATNSRGHPKSMLTTEPHEALAPGIGIQKQCCAPLLSFIFEHPSCSGTHTEGFIII